MKLEREVVEGAERPRILEFVNTFHLGGTEGQTVELLRGLAPGFECRAAAIHATGAYLADVRALGLEPLALPLGSSLARPATAWQIARLASHLRGERVQLLHAHDFYTALLGVPAARLAGAKVIVGRLDLGHWLGRGQRLALALATRAADRVVANAEAIKRQLVEEEHLPAQRISVIPNGIDLARFDRARGAPLAAPLPALDGRLAVAHVANMTHPVKAQEDLFEAVRLLRARDSRLLVLLIGDGPRRPALEQLAQRLGVRDSLAFLGHRSDVPAILSRCRAGVLCSHAEGLSNAVIEGMAAGLPMVVTDAGGNKELVRDGERGFVVPVRAPVALAARLDALLASPELCRTLGRQARDFVERELGIKALLQRHASLYREVLALS